MEVNAEISINDIENSSENAFVFELLSELSASLFYANAIETFMTLGTTIGPFGILNQ